MNTTSGRRRARRRGRCEHRPPPRIFVVVVILTSKSVRISARYFYSIGTDPTYVSRGNKPTTLWHALCCSVYGRPICMSSMCVCVCCDPSILALVCTIWYTLDQQGSYTHRHPFCCTDPDAPQTARTGIPQLLLQPPDAGAPVDPAPYRHVRAGPQPTGGVPHFRLGRHREYQYRRQVHRPRLRRQR